MYLINWDAIKKKPISKQFFASQSIGFVIYILCTMIIIKKLNNYKQNLTATFVLGKYRKETVSEVTQIFNLQITLVVVYYLFQNTMKCSLLELLQL